MVPYALSKLVIALLSPLGTALVLCGVGVLLLGAARRTGRTIVALGVAWLWVWSTPIVSESFQRHLEAQYPPMAAESLSRADAIVVLGGALAPPSRDRIYPDLGAAADRIWHVARVYRAGKAALVVASGGSDAAVTPISEAESIAGLLVELGVPGNAILQERTSRTTRENAEFTAAMLRSRRVHSILLVTSALHMRRAVGEFERAGFRVIPAATDHAQPHSAGIQQWLPDTGALDNSARGFKEMVGAWAAGTR